MVLQRSTLLKLDLGLGQVDLTFVRHTAFWSSIWPQHFIKHRFFITFNFLYITYLRQLFTASPWRPNIESKNTFKTCHGHFKPAHSVRMKLTPHSFTILPLRFSWTGLCNSGIWKKYSIFSLFSFSLFFFLFACLVLELVWDNSSCYC